MPRAIDLKTLFGMPSGAGAADNDAERGRVHVAGLSRRFGKVQAVHPLDLELGPGEVTGLIGPNGSGKSTFLRLLTGLVRPDAGTASVDGAELRGDGTAVRRRATFAPGEIHLYGEMRAEEQLAWLLRGRDAGALPRALEILGALELDPRAPVRSFSHGMKRQLLFAAALAPDVRVRFFDEPTEGLDPAKRALVADLMRQDADRGTTVLLSSHHFGEVEAVCGRVLFMSGGRLIADETAESVLQKASRMLHLRFASAAPELESLLTGPGTERVTVVGERAMILLDEPDPNAYLHGLQERGAPAPTSIVFGELSLQELYRDLYGVEGY